MKTKIYVYEKCSTCKNALKYLEKKKIYVEIYSIVETPPTTAELKKMSEFYEGNFRKLFNTSGLVYKAMKLKDKMETMTENQAFQLLTKNGKLIKRPFLLSKDFGLVGFKEMEWNNIT